MLILLEKGRVHGALGVVLADSAELEAAFAAIETQASSTGPERSKPRASRRRYRRRLPVQRAGGVTRFLQTEEIHSVQAANQYVEIHTGSKKYVIRRSMRSMEEHLDPRLFLRIHRSTIVNLERVRELRSVSSVDRWVVLSDGSRHRVSQGRWDELRRALLEVG